MTDIAMDRATGSRTPAHLWIVGGLALLWNGFGAYDYVMTRTRNMDYLSSMPGIDADALLAYIDAFPLWASLGWGLGVWTALAGSVLLLMRSRWAVAAFALSLLGMVLGLGYQLAVPAGPAVMPDGPMQFMPWVILAIGIAFLYYAYRQRARGVLR